jgi:hypothetical protein
VLPQIGKSLFDKEGAKLVEGIFAKAQQKGVQIHLPVDFVTANKIGKDAEVLLFFNSSSALYSLNQSIAFCIFCIFAFLFRLASLTTKLASLTI